MVREVHATMVENSIGEVIYYFIIFIMVFLFITEMNLNISTKLFSNYRLNSYNSPLHRFRSHFSQSYHRFVIPRMTTKRIVMLFSIMYSYSLLNFLLTAFTANSFYSSKKLIRKLKMSLEFNLLRDSMAIAFLWFDWIMCCGISIVTPSHNSISRNSTINLYIECGISQT